MASSGKNKKSNLCEFHPDKNEVKNKKNRESAIINLAESVKSKGRKFISRELDVVNSSSFEKMRFLALSLLAAGLLVIVFYGWLSSHAETKGWLVSHKKYLAVGIPSDLVSLDPAVASSSLSAQVLSPVFDTLVKFEHGEVKPNLAQNWTCSADNKTWTFNLRSDVRFHNGYPLSSKVVTEWINRLILGKDRSFSFFRANFAGSRPILAEVKSLDEYRVQFVLNYPCADFLELLASPAMAITLSEDKADGSQIVYGSGPFAIAEWRTGQRLVLRSATQCWRGNSAFEEIVFLVITDPQSRVRELERGNIDILLTLPLDKVKAIKENHDLKLIKPKSSVKLALVPNCTHRPFNDVRGRLALSFAIPKKAVLQRFFVNRGQVHHSLFSPLSWAQVPSKLQAEYSAVKAKRMFNRMYGGESEIGKLTLLYCQNSYAAADLEPTAKFLASCLNDVGLSTEVCGAGLNEYRRSLAGNLYDLCLVAEEIPSLDPSIEINKVLADPSRVHDEYNISNYASQRILRLLEAARSTENKQERLECYKAVQTKLDNDGLEFNIGWTDLIHACKKNVHCLYADRWGILHFENAYID